MKISVDLTKKYALAVSGGADSMVLLHLFAMHKPRVNFFVVTINHNLRNTAKSDCQFVQSVCQKYQVECVYKEIDCAKFSKDNKVSIETAGRVLRRQIFESLDCDFVVTAHHKDDNVESVLMHVLRGSGLKGASGIKEKDGKYFRPLLAFSKQEIVDFAKENEIGWQEDETNQENVFLRNKIRNQVLPLLEESFANCKDNVIRFAENAEQDEQFLWSLADVSKVKVENNTATIPIELLCQPFPIAVRVLQKTFQLLNVFCDVEKTHLLSLVQLAQKQGGKKVHLPFDLSAVNDYNCITIFKNDQRKNVAEQIVFEKNAQTYFTSQGKVQVSEGQGKLHFDMDKIPSGAVLRTRESGDVFCPFGGGTKKLKEWLIDKKVCQRKRDDLLLVAKGKEILIVVGMEISDRIKIDQSTKNIFHVDKE